jgi:hypothetical protein
MSLLTPSSYGEAFDRLTILQLKLDYITDVRRADVQREFIALQAILADKADDVVFHYAKLLEVNRIMWKIQEELHEEGISKQPDREYALMREINIVNERRFRIKRAINERVGSLYKEQKGYKGRKVFVLSHLGMGDHIFMNGAIRYLASLYDEVTVVVKNTCLENVRDLFYDEPAVTFHVVGADSDISPNFGAPVQLLENAVAGYDSVALLGYHGTRNVENFPYCFYDDLKIPHEAMMTWAHVPMHLSVPVAPKEPYWFVHSQSSNLEAPIVVDTEAQLCLNPSKNLYPEGHRWYEVAEKWVGRPILDYAQLLKGATKCVMVDSSFFCLALTLGLTPEVWCRNGRSYKNVNAGLVENFF